MPELIIERDGEKHYWSAKHQKYIARNDVVREDPADDYYTICAVCDGVDSHEHGCPALTITDVTPEEERKSLEWQRKYHMGDRDWW